MKKRISATVDEETIKILKEILKWGLYRNMSHAVEEAIKLFLDHHRVNPVPVVDDQKRVVGIVSRYDVLKIFGMIKM